MKQMVELFSSSVSIDKQHGNLSAVIKAGIQCLVTADECGIMAVLHLV